MKQIGQDTESSRRKTQRQYRQRRRNRITATPCMHNALPCVEPFSGGCCSIINCVRGALPPPIELMRQTACKPRKPIVKMGEVEIDTDMLRVGFRDILVFCLHFSV